MQWASFLQVMDLLLGEDAQGAQEFIEDQGDDLDGPPTPSEMPSENEEEEVRADEADGLEAQGAGSHSLGSVAPQLASASGGPADASTAEPRSDRQAFVASHGLVEESTNRLCKPTGEPVGTIYFVGPNGFKAVCKTHGTGRCSCYLSVKSAADHEATERALIGWLAAAADAAVEGHQEQARELKLARGVRIRR